jgi:hypothetical protein
MNVLALAASLALAQAPEPEAPPPSAGPAAAHAEAAPAPAPAPAPDPAAPPPAKPARQRTPTPDSEPAHPERGVAPGDAKSKETPTRGASQAAFGPEEAERAARAFLDALVRGDAEALTAAASDRFSFDGEVQSGREAIRRRWRTLLSDRAGAAARVGAIQVVPVAEAVARHGKPPARLAGLARPGVLVAIADVGGRTVVLFVAREAGRTAVLGMQG